MDKIFSQRLTRLADALERNEHGHEQWDFCTVALQFGCGTAGCAMGSLPYVFPKEWEFAGDMMPVLIGQEYQCGIGSPICEFLGLTDDDRASLFEKNGYGTWDVTPQMVAAKIRAFLELKAKATK